MARVGDFNWRRRHPDTPMFGPDSEVTMLAGIQRVALTTVCGVPVLVCVEPFIAYRARIVAWGEEARALLDASVDLEVELAKFAAVDQCKCDGHGNGKTGGHAAG
jgi:hypothetical protein